MELNAQSLQELIDEASLPLLGELRQRIEARLAKLKAEHESAGRQLAALLGQKPETVNPPRRTRRDKGQPRTYKCSGAGCETRVSSKGGFCTACDEVEFGGAS